MFLFLWSYCTGTLFPVCPIVGGVMAQEIIKVNGKAIYILIYILFLHYTLFIPFFFF